MTHENALHKVIFQAETCCSKKRREQPQRGFYLGNRGRGGEFLPLLGKCQLSHKDCVWPRRVENELINVLLSNPAFVALFTGSNQVWHL